MSRGTRLLRRTERRISQWLSERILPSLPGIPRLYSWQLSKTLRLLEGDVRLPRLATSWDGLSVLLIGDFHVGPFMTPDALRTALERLVASAHADIVLISGDFVTSGPSELEPFHRSFEPLHAPLGVYAVLGNHDYYGGGPGSLPEQIESLGMTLLRNSSRSLERDGNPLHIAGTEDWVESESDFRTALEGIGSGDPVVCLSHHPDSATLAARHDVDLLLCGHTHGGQIRFPNGGVPWPMSRHGFDHGHYLHEETHVVVTHGVGVVGLPIRLFCPPDGVLLHLRAPAFDPTPRRDEEIGA